MDLRQQKREFYRAMHVAYDEARAEEARDLLFALLTGQTEAGSNAARAIAEWRAAGWSPKSERA